MKPIIINIQKLLKHNLNIANVNLTYNSNLKKDLDLADWDVAYLLNNIEYDWHISITDVDNEKIMNLKYLSEVILEKVGASKNIRSIHI